MDYTITIKEDVDTTAIDKLNDKIEQLHSGKFAKNSKMEKLHKKIEDIHDEKHQDKFNKLLEYTKDKNKKDTV